MGIFRRTQNFSTHGIFLLNHIHWVPRSEKPMNATSDTLSIFNDGGKFKIADFYQNVLKAKIWKSLKVVILYIIGKEIWCWTTFLIELWSKNVASWNKLHKKYLKWHQSNKNPANYLVEISFLKPKISCHWKLNFKNIYYVPRTEQKKSGYHDMYTRKRYPLILHIKLFIGLLLV